MSKKLITAGLVAALAFSVPSVATAQSSAPALSSSSETKSVSKTQQVEDKFAAALIAEGHTRHAQHDQAAEKAVQGAINGNVAFTVSPHANFPGLAGAETISGGYGNIILRFPAEHIDTVLRNIDAATGTVLSPTVSVPFGIAVDESQSLVYLAVSIPISALL